jgi:hypothetical protein
LRIDRTEEEQAIRYHRAAGLAADVTGAGGRQVHRAVDGRDLVVRALEGIRTEVAECTAAERVASALRDDVDDTARRLAVLRLVAAGLHLGFLDEVEGDAVAERPEDDRIRA